MSDDAQGRKIIELSEIVPRISLEYLRAEEREVEKKQVHWRATSKQYYQYKRPKICRTRQYLDILDGTIHCTFRSTPWTQDQPVVKGDELWYYSPYEARGALPKHAVYPVVKRVQPTRDRTAFGISPDTIVNVQGKLTWGTVTEWNPKLNNSKKDPPTEIFPVLHVYNTNPYYLEIVPRETIKPAGKRKFEIQRVGFKPAHKWSPVHYVPQQGTSILKKRRYPLEFPIGLLELPVETIRQVLSYLGPHWWRPEFLPVDHQERTSERQALYGVEGYYPWQRGIPREDYRHSTRKFKDSDDDSLDTVLPEYHPRRVRPRSGLKSTGLIEYVPPPVAEIVVPAVPEAPVHPRRPRWANYSLRNPNLPDNV